MSTSITRKWFEKHLVNGEMICPNKKCNKVIKTFLSPKLLKGLQDKSITSMADATSKSVDLRN